MQVNGVTLLVPVRLAVTSLPAGHVQVVVRGLPPQYARSGVHSLLMSLAGYGPGSGASVVHERAGLVPLPEDLPGEMLSFDRVVGVAVTPAADPCLSLLPSEIVIEGWTASITVSPALADSPAVLLRRQSECRQPSPSEAAPVQQPHHGWVPPGGRLSATFATGGGGLGGGPWAPASALVVTARLSGDRRGLGFAPAQQQQQQQQPAPLVSQGQPGHSVVGHAPPAALPGQGAALPTPPVPEGVPAVQPEHVAPVRPLQPRDADMLPAPPLSVGAAEPTHEPGFGVALEYITDRSDLLRSAAVTLLQAVRTHSPDVYAAVRDASAPGDLARPFREALYSQARGLFGGERAGQLSVSPAAVALWGGVVDAEARGLSAQGVLGQAGAPPGAGQTLQPAAARVAHASARVVPAALPASPSTSDEEHTPPRRSSRQC